MTTQPAPAPTIAPYLDRTDQGEPMLIGSCCEACGQLFAGKRDACAHCGARDRMKPTRLAEQGKLYVYTIVHRSFPGVSTPFIDAIVDLEDGSHIKGILRGIAPDPDAIAFDMPVRLAFEEAEPINAPGQPHLIYYFTPA